jgi:hypothetical protein
LSLAVAALVEVILGPVIYYLAIDSPVVGQLERLQKPGATVALAIYRHSFPHLGRPWSVYLGVARGFLIPITIWSRTCFSVLSIFRFLNLAKSS